VSWCIKGRRKEKNKNKKKKKKKKEKKEKNPPYVKREKKNLIKRYGKMLKFIS
jgi:hypothetical protein